MLLLPELATIACGRLDFTHKRNLVIPAQDEGTMQSGKNYCLNKYIDLELLLQLLYTDTIIVLHAAAMPVCIHSQPAQVYTCAYMTSPGDATYDFVTMQCHCLNMRQLGNSSNS